MNLEPTYNSIKEVFFDNDYDSRYNDISRSIEKYIDAESIRYVYPKNLWMKDVDFQFQVYTDDKIFILEQKEDSVNIKVWKSSDIIAVEYVDNGYRSPAELTINLTNGYKIELVPERDIHQQFKRDLMMLPEEIFKYLL